jgi:hypothetical protein
MHGFCNGARRLTKSLILDGVASDGDTIPDDRPSSGPLEVIDDELNASRC